MMVEIVILIVVLYFFFLWMSMKVEKGENMVSPYECGFDPIVGSRLIFSFRFFLISILFLVFDVEISLLLPLPYCVGFGVSVGLIVFLGLLLGGLVYEYFNGILVWSF